VKNRYDLTSPVDSSTLMSHLRDDFPELRPRRNVFGNVVLKVRFDITVIFCLRRASVRIYTTHPLWYAFFVPRGGMGFADDEKRHYLGIYAKWFTLRYRDSIAASRAEP